ncbi:MAG: hypothetical protein MN733_42600, partial [Nitrososphaera sp.]|nr:hypothetical protein [Nitrososphaera sp.]
SVEELQQYDTRPPVEAMRRLTTSDPSYGLAFRMLIEKKVSSKALMDLAREQSEERKKKG